MAYDLAEATMGEVVAIAIGPGKTLFRVHKDILCKKSEYFRTAYNGRWKEADEGVVLEDVEVGMFKIFMHWLYTEQLPIEAADVLRIAFIDTECGMPGSKHCASLITFTSTTCTFSVATYEEIIFAYGNLPRDSRILDLMVETQCLSWSADDDIEEEKQELLNLPKEFFIQVMLKFAEFRDEDDNDKQLKKKDYYMRE